MTVSYVNPTMDIYIGRLVTATSSTYAQNSGWVTPQEDSATFMANGDGYLAVILKGHNGEDITSSDYDCFISLYSCLQNHYDRPSVHSMISDKADYTAAMLAAIRNDVDRDPNEDVTLRALFESAEAEDVDGLMDENGTTLMFPVLRLKDYFDKDSVHAMLSGKADYTAKELGRLEMRSQQKPNAAPEWAFESCADTLDDGIGNPLLEEDGELLLCDSIRIKDSDRFIPENYQYNAVSSGTYSRLALPILYLYGDMAQMTKSKKATLTARFKDIRMGCSCKWQGASSVNFPKKNYSVTFDGPVVIKPEWGCKKKYVLKSEFLDNTHTRNTVSARLWAQIVRDREMINGATTLDDQNGVPFTLEDDSTAIDIVNSAIMGSPGCGANDGFHIMLVMNNKYMGLYTMGIPKDDWMFGMDNGSSKCCVLNAEKNCLQTRFRATTTEQEIEEENTFSIEYASDDMTLTRITSSLNTMLGAVINSSGDHYREAVGQYFDLDSAMDYLIYSMMIGNWDGVSHNYNLVTFDGVKWRFSAYDLDNTFGVGDLREWSFESLYDNPAELTPNLSITATDQRLLYIIKQYDKEAFKARYAHLRATVLSENNIYTSFYNFIALVSKRVLAEEFNRWPTTPRSGAQYIDAILNFYRLRCLYMDAAVAAL